MPIGPYRQSTSRRTLGQAISAGFLIGFLKSLREVDAEPRNQTSGPLEGRSFSEPPVSHPGRCCRGVSHGLNPLPEYFAEVAEAIHLRVHRSQEGLIAVGLSKACGCWGRFLEELRRRRNAEYLLARAVGVGAIVASFGSVQMERIGKPIDRLQKFGRSSGEDSAGVQRERLPTQIAHHTAGLFHN